MSEDGSVTEWIAQLREGDERALYRLHQRYWPLLVRLARKKLRDLPRRAADEQDVAQEAFLGFYQSLRTGRLPRLRTRDDLWSLFVVITARKAAKQFEREHTAKRGGGRVRGDSVVEHLASSNTRLHAHAEIEDPQPGPDELALLHDCYEKYLARLPEPLRPFAELYLAGCTYPEIATRLGCAPRTVERKIPLILKKWQELAADSVAGH